MPPANQPLRHLRILDSTLEQSFTAYGGGGGEYNVPGRERKTHAAKLRGQLKAASDEVTSRGAIDESGRCLITYQLTEDADDVLDSLDRSLSRIRIRSAHKDESGWRVVVSLPIKKFKIVDNVLSRYETKNNDSDDPDSRPKGEPLVARIDAIAATIQEDLWTDARPLPSPGEEIWWEVWLEELQVESTAQPTTLETFTQAAALAGFTIPTNLRATRFPERVVLLVRGAIEFWQSSPLLLLPVAELRAGKSIAADFDDLQPRESAEFAHELAEVLSPPSADSAAVSLLDTGIRSGHPLLKPFVDERCVGTIDPAWSAADSGEQHGTAMAGIAAYNDLTPVMLGQSPPPAPIVLESMRLVGPSDEDRTDLFGEMTAEAVDRLQSIEPSRKRAICITSTTGDPREGALPSSWSASLDQIAAGVRINADQTIDRNLGQQLLFVAGGNLRNEIADPTMNYPMVERPDFGIEDPGQSWNAITVGAVTDKVDCGPGFDKHVPIARPGQLSPTSRTSNTWIDQKQQQWPLKPDLVFEGGNWAKDDSGRACDLEGLGLLTTCLDPTSGRLVTVTRDTSPATAAVSGMAARFWNEYPDLWPETIRAVMVHTAEWDHGSKNQVPATTKTEFQTRLRHFGYGRPDLDRARYSLKNKLNLIYEGELQPFRMDASDKKAKANQMHLHRLPWPTRSLNQLGSVDIEMRVTLSYFIEPSPGRRGWGDSFRYASHGLRFDVKSPTVTTERLIAQYNSEEKDLKTGDFAGLSDRWVIGSQGRTRGSLHSDWWTGTAAELAASGEIIVYPTTGWWRERKHLGQVESKARYSLVVPLSAPSVTADLYSELVNEVTVAAL
ncbi:Subtilase family protein [Neorhodopirellula lusitana]|uniref:Subtilase family protein n=1 Tax=Neorhodopirellula lusitana TaxID=445327 RepID=A0ABY1QP24_9BACT|nr:S8 family peptidase [Neorhodopirellula lusitana]SMP74936.1 Subtilase family protein [Neorhodopirellula lusitana]